MERYKECKPCSIRREDWGEHILCLHLYSLVIWESVSDINDCNLVGGFEGQMEELSSVEVKSFGCAMGLTCYRVLPAWHINCGEVGQEMVFTHIV